MILQMDRFRMFAAHSLPTSPSKLEYYINFQQDHFSLAFNIFVNKADQLPSLTVFQVMKVLS